MKLGARERGGRTARQRATKREERENESERPDRSIRLARKIRRDLAASTSVYNFAEKPLDDKI